MSAHLPPNLQKLFTPRPNLNYVTQPCTDRRLSSRTTQQHSGVAQYLKYIGFDDQYQPSEAPLQRRRRVREERIKRAQLELQRQLKEYDPYKLAESAMVVDSSLDYDGDGDAADDLEEGEVLLKQLSSNPYNTLFVGNIPTQSTEEDIKGIFDRFGDCKVFRIKKPNGVVRPYAFIEYDNEESLKRAYHSMHTNSPSIHGQQLLIDVERGRTVPDWKPRRLGGGIKSKKQSTMSNNNSRRGSSSAKRSRHSMTDDSGRHNKRRH
ncbi:hypothetical protein MP228_006430 [Amoeboaphelidium protococcarum]|nr:hypothetical protein MP228_006430 [Amoeboaphelidium protococcarum]